MSLDRNSPLRNKTMDNLKVSNKLLRNLIFIDWDDTLFPTTWLMSNYKDLPSVDVEHYIDLDASIHKVITKLVRYGKVIIITNAGSNWINASLEMLPKSTPIIQKHIEIMSARDAYSSKYPQDTTLWKILAFQKIYNKYKTSDLHSIISFGDADHEFKALVNLDDIHPNPDTNFKNIKLISNPRIDQILEQHEIMHHTLHHIATHNDYLDLQFDNLVDRANYTNRENITAQSM